MKNLKKGSSNANGTFSVLGSTPSQGTSERMMITFPHDLRCSSSPQQNKTNCLLTMGGAITHMHLAFALSLRNDGLGKHNFQVGSLFLVRDLASHVTKRSFYDEVAWKLKVHAFHW